MPGFSSNPRRRREKVNATGASHGEDLPSELINEVLSRLPTISIGRFRCACKQWHTLLSDPQFLKLQFSRNRDNGNKLISICKFSPNLSLLYSVDICKDNYSNGDNVVAIGKPLNSKHYDMRYKIHGSCNGLLLLSDGKCDLFISNPITCKTRQLPSCIDRNSPHDGYAFGYDSCNDDYIVVILFRGNINPDNYRTTRTMYMFKRNRWKRVQDCPCYGQFYIYSGGFSVNGAIHWLGLRVSDGCKVICAFDLADEKFRELELPDELKRIRKLYIPKINVLGGCLSIVICNISSSIELWVMKEYEVKESWTKYSVYHSRQYCRTMPVFLWDGDASVVTFCNQQLFLCNLKEKTSKKIEVQGQRLEARYGHVWTFAESLFSPNCINGIEGGMVFDGK